MPEDQTPDHYLQGSYHCIEVMSDLHLDEDFYLGNAFKYLWRCASHTDGKLSNIKKAHHYLGMWLEKNSESSEY